MRGILFAVDPDSSTVVSRLATLESCSSESEVERLKEYWEDRIGDDFVVLDSRKATNWGVAE